VVAKKTAAPKEQKAKKRKTPAYKPSKCAGTVSSITDAVSELESLAEECREIVDNSGEKLAETQRIQTFSETADTLEGISEPSIPDVISGDGISYIEMVPSRKGRGTSRSTRRDNAVNVLQAALDAAEDFLDDEENEEHDERSDVEMFVSEVQDIIDNAEGCEFPGMYG
jgi:hypothetical protein